MLTRKFYSEEDILRMFNESEEEEVEAEDDEDKEVSPDDLDLESMSTMDKLEFIKDILKTCDAEGCEGLIDSVDKIIDGLEED